MFGMSMAEIAMILILALVVLGPEKLPDLARTLGKTIREIRRAGNSLRDAVMLEEELNNMRTSDRALPKTDSASSSYPPPATKTPDHADLDAFDGPLDQLDEEEFGLGGSMTYDPHDYTGRTRERFEVSLRAQREALHDVRPVELAPTSPPAPPDPGLRHASPMEVPHVEARQVELHEQLPEVP